MRELRDMGYSASAANNSAIDKSKSGLDADLKKRSSPSKKPNDSYLVADKDVSLDFNL
jgi:hypothetical protein